MTVIHNLTEEILRTWLRNVGFDLQQPVRPFHTKLHAELKDYIISQDLQEHQLIRIWRLLPACTSAADTYHQLKRHVALFATFVLYVDDKVEQEPEVMIPDLQRISSQTFNGLQTIKCDDSVLTLWLELVAIETGKFYGSYSAGVITKGFVVFILGNTIEADFAADMKLPAKFGQRASKFLRDKTGAGEVFAHFIFPEHLVEETGSMLSYAPFIPGILDFVDDVNDILSFYKESVVGSEMNTNIMNRARSSCCSPHDVLRQMCGDIAETMNVVSTGLAGKGISEKLWKDIANGYIMWHICQGRYRLKEIGLVMRV
ncbi:isoprenoid synthase domain-containing protein [Penicillium brevicompactum]|uniref:Isoprenoid synthase domain-containing protein n=1 Tax=Penicillium brevicompactum TaxID=5074 RepID=A0A9W9QT64_PENBR|nr:isoprenoid synthase domain-containing protein [Penicillium brevicompactum]